jgi:O-acetyl-ADP-ribose deacetylase (regulator of RNase III)
VLQVLEVLEVLEGGADLEHLEHIEHLDHLGMITILRSDITTLHVDAIVNAANSALAGGGGVDGAIHAAAGPEMAAELRRYPGCPTGSAVMTRGYRLPARFVIHAVGPIWRNGRENEPELLARAYESSFRLARDEGSIRTIAFPAISTGVYGFPRPQAAEIALGVMIAHEREFEAITACLFDEASAQLYRDRYAQLRARVQ